MHQQRALDSAAVPVAMPAIPVAVPAAIPAAIWQALDWPHIGHWLGCLSWVIVKSVWPSEWMARAFSIYTLTYPEEAK
jgi:hypothetical protein